MCTDLKGIEERLKERNTGPAKRSRAAQEAKERICAVWVVGSPDLRSPVRGAVLGQQVHPGAGAQSGFALASGVHSRIGDLRVSLASVEAAELERALQGVFGQEREAAIDGKPLRGASGEEKVSHARVAFPN
ncbi:MAG: hypothetical protein NZ840_13225 [Anaerolineales bacterium]|nr:hypothetical protein [Anaerolineales bacterium]MDW8162996.1 hypothetical protein [Anaerolineales bacterium]